MILIGSRREAAWRDAAWSDAVRQSKMCELGRRVQTEFGHHSRSMRLDRAHAERKIGRYLFVGHPRNQQTKYVDLSRRQTHLWRGFIRDARAGRGITHINEV